MDVKSLLSLLSGFLVCLALGFSYLLFLPKKKKKKRILEEEQNRLQTLAGKYEVTWKNRETFLLIIFSFFFSAFLYLLTDNYLLLGLSWLFLIYLPDSLLLARKRKKRMKQIESLSETMKHLTVRLEDQGNFVRAAEDLLRTKPNLPLNYLFANLLEEMRLGLSFEEAIDNLKKAVHLRKFDYCADTLSAAHKAGWTKQAIDALNQSVGALEEDLTAIRLTAAYAKEKKKKLYSAIGISWSFPVILSMFSVTEGWNLYLDSLPGKILMAVYFCTTFFVLIKGEQFISLDVDEL